MTRCIIDLVVWLLLVLVWIISVNFLIVTGFGGDQMTDEVLLWVKFGK